MDCKNVILLLGFLACFSAAAQPRLVILKGDKVITSFCEGDYIRFKRKDRDHFTAGLIGGLTKDYFRIGGDTTLIYSLEKIDLSERDNSGFRTRAIGATFIAAGTVFFLGDLFNETVINDEPYSANTGVITASALLVTTGVLMQFLNNDNFVLGRRKKVVVIDR
ncbi:MAG: hypothetical protein KF725_14250 [Cyclobacteriaceae bacterium]|nr:hypothetical protein [Cyclobacteriaceae bacterium]UYN87477.1 MAG: hypothetical protein KIT51_04205 [Cyclobacteriaceae bacterium]